MSDETTIEVIVDGVSERRTFTFDLIPVGGIEGMVDGTRKVPDLKPGEQITGFNGDGLHTIVQGPVPEPVPVIEVVIPPNPFGVVR